MSDEQFEHDVLDRVGIDRRAFVKKLALGTAFAIPVVTSFSMDSLGVTTAYARVANQTSGMSPG